MRILHVGKFFPPVAGGMERFLGDLVQAQRASGHDVTVLVHEHPASDGAKDPSWVLRCPVWLRLIFAPISPTFMLWLHRAIRSREPDVIHFHVPNLGAFWAMMLPSARALPWVVHWHSDVVPSRFKISLRIAYPFYRLFQRALLERVERIIVTSQTYLDASAPLQPWRAKVSVIPLGVDPERLPSVASADTEGLWKGEGLRIFALGRLTYYKGFETLVRAVLQQPGLQLALVGEGEERPNLERLLVDARDSESVRLLGETDDTTCQRLMASCDVFCLPSRERTEAFGIVLMEAMRYAKPVVVGAVPGSGMLWVARHGENGMHVPPGDVEAWRTTLTALAADPDALERMGRAGRRRYAIDFDIANVATRIDRVYEVALRTRLDDPVTPAVATQRLLVVIPALNEADCIADVIKQARAQGEIDIVVIDDGSTDDTARIAREAGAVVLHAPLWQGAWGAIQTGIRYARREGYQAVVTMDADGQHEPGHLPHLIAASKDADVVIAACPARGSRARHVAWAYFRFLTGFKYEDLTSGFRYYNTRAIELLATREATLLDYQDVGVLLLLHHAHLKIAEIPVAMNARKSGISRVFFSWWTIVGYMAETTLLCLARWERPKKKT
ncbi:glycosyltransferase [Usitatibacter palustris]|uniref:D-inositol-3-phosphate glycosyltransferase n=1 Tax=Usitatibacter palustris TaxID=2732487 RepID=A0A6M4HDA3_9PROT|nr:glycosyltransferase [Usitatibacter palustris]QJR16534.1 D-inositol-3-phosphate glycosyltransferase [Usitatibacter palustris]